MTAERIFLGWDQPALPRAAKVLGQEYSNNFEDVLVALPGARAARRLEELLLDACGAAWIPPRIGTIGEITDTLVRFSKPRASGLAREFAWMLALRALPTAAFSFISSNRPGDEDLNGWAALASQLRALHQDLAAERRRFTDVFPCEILPPSEKERWRALAAVQATYQRIISDCGQCDPHMERLRVLESREPLLKPRALVLVGVAAMNGLQASLATRAAELGVPVLALIVAPESEAAGFDEFGLLKTEAWAERSVPLDEANWHVVDRPADQAEEVVRFFASALPEGAPTDDATVCVLHDEVIPCLERTLIAQGTDLRPAVGGKLARSSPFMFLDGMASWLASESTVDLAALARHPWWFAARAGSSDPAALLDRRLASTLLLRLGADDAEVPECISRFARLRPLRPAMWAKEIRILLAALSEADSGNDTSVSAEALEALLHALDELEQIPDSIGHGPLSAVAILQFVLHALRSQELPPDPRRHGIEMLGWLELPLDEAPALAVVGFQQGTVPETVHGHAFLPEGLRLALGIPSNSDRRARDAWAIHVLCGGSRTCAWISGRHSTAGEPWLPSPFALLAAQPGSRPDVAARVQRFFPEHAQAPANFAPRSKIWKIPLPPPAKFNWPVFSASQINDYLSSPLLFWLKHVKGLREIGVEPHELDGAAFGNLAHAVLARFAADPEMRAESRAKAIRERLEQELQQEAIERFGPDPAVVVGLQIEILRRRLENFSTRQAVRAQQGWRILHAEWPPQESECAKVGVELTINGTTFRLRGRIDRVDKHETTGQYCILDYKSRDQGYDRKRAYLKGRNLWTDVQLPLYRHLLRALESLPQEADVLTGWFNLPRESGQADCYDPEWTAQEFERADEQVAQVVHEIQEGRFAATKDDRMGVDEEYQPILAGLLGLGTLDLSPTESEEESV